MAQTIEDFVSQDPLPGEQFGAAVASADIINGPSGTQYWVIVGVPYATAAMATAAGNVEFFPTVNSPTAPRFKINAPSGHIQSDAHFGFSLATGDVDGDGTIDLVAGAPHHDVGSVTDQGRAFVFFGPWSPTGTPPYSDWAYLDVDPGEVSTGAEPGGEFGTSVAVGAPTLVRLPSAWDPGAVFITYGQTGPMNSWPVLDPPYFDPTPTPGGLFGSALARALRFGTANLDDLVIGSPNADIPGHLDAGEAFVFNH